MILPSRDADRSTLQAGSADPGSSTVDFQGAALSPPAVHRAGWLTIETLCLLAMLGDAAAILLTGFLAAAWPALAVTPGGVLWPVCLGTLAAILLLRLAGAYTPAIMLDPGLRLRRITIVWPATLLLILALARIGAAPLTLGWLGAWLVLAALALAGTQQGGGRILRRLGRAGRLGRNVVIVGAGPQGQRLVEHLRRQDRSLRLIGLFDDRRDRVPDFVAGFPVLGTIEDLQAFSRRHRVDEVLVALPWGAEGRLLACLDRLRALPADIRLCSDMIGFHLPHRGLGHVAGLPTLQIFERPLEGPALLGKRAADLVLASFLIVLMAPALLLVALFLRLGGGSVLTSTDCRGLNGQPFRAHRFRTHRATFEGPRLTPMGQFLRQSRLDGLPQLLNVVAGEMSLVGPSPHPLSQDERYRSLIERYPARLRVKPGMTGWARVNGQAGEAESVADMERRVELDLDYVQRWSPGLDLEIMLLTLWHGLVPAAARRRAAPPRDGGRSGTH